MARGNLDYVASLEQDIRTLRQILQEWTPYVPQEEVLKRKPLIERIYPSTTPITERQPSEDSPSTPIDSTQNSQGNIDGLPSNAQNPKKRHGDRFRRPSFGKSHRQMSGPKKQKH